LLRDKTRSLVLHHTHPLHFSFSSSDISLLPYPGVHSIWLHAHGGLEARVALTPAARALFDRGNPDRLSEQSKSSSPTYTGPSHQRSIKRSRRRRFLTRTPRYCFRTSPSRPCGVPGSSPTTPATPTVPKLRSCNSIQRWICLPAKLGVRPSMAFAMIDEPSPLATLEKLEQHLDGVRKLSDDVRNKRVLIEEAEKNLAMRRRLGPSS
jgi:hypothetical protein